MKLQKLLDTARFDSWFNVFTGLGTGRDKTSQTLFMPNRVLQAQELRNLFHHDDMANRIVTALPLDAMREGFHVTLHMDDKDSEDVQQAINVVEKRLKTLNTAYNITRARIFGRLYGNSCLFLGVSGAGFPYEPLDDSQVKTIDFFTVIEQPQLQPKTWYSDPFSQKYGEVETYYLTPMSGTQVASPVVVHETRLLKFGGILTAQQDKSANYGNDYSVLQPVWNVLRDTNANWQSVVAMMADCSQPVFKLRGLIEGLAESEHTALSTRMRLMDMMKSVTRSIVLDAETEEYSLVERGAITGIDGLLQHTWMRLSAAARMPLTVLMGMSPAGLNATGESDLSNWYTQIGIERKDILEPAIVRMVRLVGQEVAPNINPDAWGITWPSLWSMDPVEEAEYRNKVADVDKKYIDMGVALPEEIALSRFGRGTFNGTEFGINLEMRKELLEAETARVTQGEDNGTD